MIIYSKKTQSGHLAFDSKINKKGIIGAALYDMDDSQIYQNLWETVEKSPFDQAQLGAAYMLEKINEEEVVLWFFHEDIEYNNAEHIILKIKTLKRIIELWLQEKEEFEQDPEGYKKLIEKGEKIFEIEEN